MIAVRLSDVQPDDKATRVTYGVLNLTHRDGHAEPAPLEPGRRYRVRVRLNDIAQAFPQGHRLRISISTSYFPLAWPPPEPVRVTIFAGASELVLPERAHREEAIAFAEAEGAASGARKALSETHHNWRVIRDLAADRSTLEVIDDDGYFELEDVDLKLRKKAEERYSYQGDDFSSAKGETLWRRGIQRGGWTVETVTRTVLSCDPSRFKVSADLDAYEDKKLVYSRYWNIDIERDLV